MRILVDMDGVMSDFEGEFLKRWKELYPDRMFIPFEKRTTFYVVDQYPPEWKRKIYQIFCTAGFYRTQKPIPGSIEALEEMQRMGFEVFFCTSPLTEYQNCVLEKFEWVDEHLGKDWIKRLILAKDKTVIRADVLIDDRPKIEGLEKPPSWEHVLFDAPYNKNEPGKRRLNWQNWKDVLLGG